MGRFDGFEFVEVVGADSSERHQPCVDDAEADFLVAHSGSCAAAACVPAEDDFLDTDDADGVFEHGEEGHVGGVDDVGDVTVREDVAGLEAEECGFRNSRVGAADPEDLG